MSSCINSRTRPGADHDTDHILLESKIRLKTFNCQQSKMALKHDIDKLNDPKIKEHYSVSTENRFEALLLVTDEDKRPEELMSEIENIFFLKRLKRNWGRKRAKRKSRGYQVRLLS